MTIATVTLIARLAPRIVLRWRGGMCIDVHKLRAYAEVCRVRAFTDRDFTAYERVMQSLAGHARASQRHVPQFRLGELVSAESIPSQEH